MLTEPTDLGVAYRVDLRLRPEGSHGPICLSFDGMLSYYDVPGRTWERQALVKARPIAGDLDLGREFLDQLEPWIYRRYLSRADITGIKALKRRIEQRAEARRGRLPQRQNGPRRHSRHRVRHPVPATAQRRRPAGPAHRQHAGSIARLEAVGCLTHQERTHARRQLRFLRKIEHRLQIMFDLQTHMLPDDRAELRKLAIRMGYADTPGSTRRWPRSRPTTARKTGSNRKILDHLLHDAFSDDAPDRAGSRSGARSRSAAGADRRSAGPLSVSTTFRRPIKT